MLLSAISYSLGSASWPRLCMRLREARSLVRSQRPPGWAMIIHFPARCNREAQPAAVALRHGHRAGSAARFIAARGRRSPRWRAISSALPARWTGNPTPSPATFSCSRRLFAAHRAASAPIQAAGQHEAKDRHRPGRGNGAIQRAWCDVMPMVGALVEGSVQRRRPRQAEYRKRPTGKLRKSRTAE